MDDDPAVPRVGCRRGQHLGHRRGHRFLVAAPVGLPPGPDGQLVAGEVFAFEPAHPVSGRRLALIADQPRLDTRRACHGVERRAELPERVLGLRVVAAGGRHGQRVHHRDPAVTVDQIGQASQPLQLPWREVVGQPVEIAQHRLARQSCDHAASASTRRRI